MRILFLTQVLPYPLDAGPKVRAYYVLRHLTQTHDVTLVSFVRDTDTPAAIAHLGEFCRQVYTVRMPRSRALDAKHLVRSLLTHRPFLIVRDEVPAMKSLLAQIIAQQPPFDAIHADQLWMAPYALAARDLCQYGPRPLIVLDQHNAVYRIPQRMGNGSSNVLKRQLLELEARKLARYEVEACSQVDQVVWVTQEDYEAVAQQATQTQTNGSAPSPRNSRVIPICTDAGADRRFSCGADARRVTFLGGLHYPPNAEGALWFAKAIFPAVLAAVPAACLTVIGKQPPDALTQLDIPAANLEVTGYVNDLEPYFASTAAFVVPLLAGGGMRVKILDAWRWGVPVISTTIGAEGIEVTPGQNILIADSAPEFAAATISLLRNPLLGRQLVDAARVTLQRAYGWQTIYQAWDTIYPASVTQSA